MTLIRTPNHSHTLTDEVIDDAIAHAIFDMHFNTIGEIDWQLDTDTVELLMRKMGARLFQAGTIDILTRVKQRAGFDTSVDVERDAYLSLQKRLHGGDHETE